jgi:putative membrane protein
MWWFPHPMGVWDYVIMVINMVLFWALIILSVIGFVRYLASSNRSARSREADERMLAERFARGEIDKQEHHQRLDELRRGSRPHKRWSSDTGRRAP